MQSQMYISTSLCNNATHPFIRGILVGFFVNLSALKGALLEDMYIINIGYGWCFNF